jgi:uncharacterized membrane protein YGL010W
MLTINGFDEYSESHQHPVNQKIHWICVPAILWSTVGVFWYLSPTLSLLLIVLTLFFYIRLSPRITIAMTVSYLLILLSVSSINKLLPELCLLVFFVAWLFQFVGHRIEGKKPSFFKGLQFLLIGPIWCLAYLFKWLNLRY